MLKTIFYLSYFGLEELAINYDLRQVAHQKNQFIFHDFLAMKINKIK